jgi:hypothetical protein
MIETFLKVGMPSPFGVAQFSGMGKGTLCSEGVTQHTVQIGQQSARYIYLPFVQDGINATPSGGLDVVS